MMTFEEYLRQPCDNAACDRRASHNQSRANGSKWCNQHTDWDKPAFARNH